MLTDGGDEEQAIAALLHDAAEDQGGAPTLERIRARFGARVAAIVEALSDTLVEDRNAKPEWRPRKRAYLAHLREVRDEATLRVGVADKLYNARAILRDLRRHGRGLWDRFSAGADDQLWNCGELVGAYRASPLRSPMVEELAAVVAELREAADAAR